MGKALSVARKPLRDYNIENRAHKIISKDKPVPAPRHAADVTDYERIKKEFPEAYEEALKKHEKLDEYLKNVFVVSKDPHPMTLSPEALKKKTTPEKPLPTNRESVEDFEYGHKMPEKVPFGKVNLQKALQFIADHHKDPKTYNATKIAEDYVLPEEKVSNILKYFRMFEVYVPKQTKSSKAKFVGPTVSRPSITIEQRKQLPEPEKKNET